jgi:hypothetical protein
MLFVRYIDQCSLKATVMICACMDIGFMTANWLAGLFCLMFVVTQQ